jgi:hypothetical protein
MNSFEKLKAGLWNKKHKNFISMLVILGIKDVRLDIKNNEIILRDINKIPSDNEIELASFMMLLFNIKCDPDFISVKNQIKYIEDLELISEDSEIGIIFLKIKEIIDGDIEYVKKFTKKYFILYFPSLALKSKAI